MRELPVVTPQLVDNKKVLLRLDIDVPLREVGNGRWEVEDDFRLKADLPTLNLCLENAREVVAMGHLGRPGGKEVPQLSVAPIHQWLSDHGFRDDLENQKLKLLENLRFEKGESFDPSTQLRAQDKDEVLKFAKELAKLGDVFVNESFAAYRPAASTTVLPTLLPHAAGLRFAHEVKVLTEVREDPQRPLIAIVGGAKVEDKLPLVEALAKLAEVVLVGGLLPKKIREKNISLAPNVRLGEIAQSGIDLTKVSVEAFCKVLKDIRPQSIIKNGTMGKWEVPEGIKGERMIDQAILESGAQVIVGGGDAVAALSKLGLLRKFEEIGLVSVGGGATLNFLIEGTLPTIEALL